jgi:signal transduction histidine kinase
VTALRGHFAQDLTYGVMALRANEDIDRIFDAFFTTKSHGMGMGLSICRSIIEAHHGRLWVSPGLHHGAIFHVVLPTGELDAE